MDLALTDPKPASLSKKMGFDKRSGDSIEAILYTLFPMPLLQVKSIRFLFGNRMATLLNGGKDVIYSFMGNQSVNWSLLTLKIARKFYNRQKWGETTDAKTAICVDDTLDERYGKKVEATSLHWDRNRRTSIEGHQFLQLGISNSFGFLPPIGHIYVGRKKRSKQSKEFPDKRNAVAKSYHDAHRLAKHDLLEKLLDKVVRFGFCAPYLLADAWFGCRKNVKLALKHDMIAIFMMKRGIHKYRYQGKLYTVKALYRKFRNNMTKVKGKSFHACTIAVEYNLSDDDSNPEWIAVRIVFGRMKSAPKSSWVVLLCTDVGIELQEILETYALRWNIEVYFKEIKQYFGFGKEQSRQYTAILASIHLAMIRYILFYYLSLMYSSWSFAEIRNQVGLNLKVFSYGFIAWQSISRIIFDVLDQYAHLTDEYISATIKIDIENQVNRYFESLFPIALGILPDEIRKLDYSEKKGAL